MIHVTRDHDGTCHWTNAMSQAERFANLLAELDRVGVDPNTISAGLAVPEEDVLRALRKLPDGAGPAAFLTQLRVVTHASRPEIGDAPADSVS